MEPIWYGSVMCTAIYATGNKKGQACDNKAYYSVNLPGSTASGGPTWRCGIHSKKESRVELAKNPNRKEEKFEQYSNDLDLVNSISNMNLSNNRRGDVIVTKLFMRREPEHHPGYKKIFPNFKHGNRTDGYGCPALSPMSLGPVNHTIPYLPPATNLENFYQFAKVYALEIDPTTNAQSAAFFEYRKQGYMNSTPHRHKFDKEYLNKFPMEMRKPLYSIYIDRSGTFQTYTYIESRYFYCKIYELLATRTHELINLMSWLDKGINLQIIGYDGYHVWNTPLGNSGAAENASAAGMTPAGMTPASVTPSGNAATAPASVTPSGNAAAASTAPMGKSLRDRLMECYLDGSRPFGHELVLYTLLTVQNPSDYPWNIYRDQHPDRYPVTLLSL